MPHVIRLRGPWGYEPLARTCRRADGSSEIVPGLLPPPGQTQVPADWGPTLGPDFRGRVRYTRRFNRPSGISQIRRVELVIERVDEFGDVALNGCTLGAIPPGHQEFRAEITSRLKPHNLLVVEVERPGCSDSASLPPRGGGEDCPGGLVGEVRLEIVPAE